MKAIWNGAVLADSEETVVVEGNHYFPPDSVYEGLLKKSSMRTFCPWKGIASYLDAVVGEDENSNAAWTYRHPFPWIWKIRGYVAFREDVEVTE